MKKKILVTILATLMVMLFIPMMTMTASAADGVSYIECSWDGTRVVSQT